MLFITLDLALFVLDDVVFPFSELSFFVASSTTAFISFCDGVLAKKPKIDFFSVVSLTGSGFVCLLSSFFPDPINLPKYDVDSGFGCLLSSFFEDPINLPK